MVRTLFAVAVFAGALLAQAPRPIRLVQTIPMTGMKGHFDHFGFDARNNRLFATLQNEGRVDVFDARTGEKVGVITGVGKPHAVLYRADVNRLYITDGNHDHGKLHIVDGTTLKVLKSVDLAPGAEQFGYDATNQRLYVANGGHDAASAFGFVSVIDTEKGEKLRDVRVETPNVEGVAAESSGSRSFVNDRLHSLVAVIDGDKGVVATWPIATGKMNVAMALDETGHRLFVGCRSGLIAVFDTETGKELTDLTIGEGVDDLFFDATSKRVFASTGAGAGSLAVFQQNGADHYAPVGEIATGPGGKNGIYVPQLHRYFVGVPSYDKAEASILVYEIQ
jgi:DNA-binding beta-propeller fold protein YncE